MPSFFRVIHRSRCAKIMLSQVKLGSVAQSVRSAAGGLLSRMFYVYIIQNNVSRKIYIGQTADLVKRLKRHNKELPFKKTSFTNTKSGKWVYIYNEEYSTRLEAVKREKYLKSGQGREFIKSQVLDIHGSVAQSVRASAS
jgi:putative endonuclease